VSGAAPRAQRRLRSRAANRLGKGELRVELEDNALRLPAGEVGAFLEQSDSRRPNAVDQTLIQFVCGKAEAHTSSQRDERMNRWVLLIVNIKRCRITTPEDSL
jgi:hypothetical protein